MIYVSVDWHGFEIDPKNIERILFYYNSKTHRYEVHLNYGSENRTFKISKAKGDAIIEFLKWLGQESKELSPPGSEEIFDEVPDEEIFDSQGDSHD